MTMEELELRDRELVALGAAMGSNCVPCIEYHIPQARSAGLTDGQIAEAVQLADKVRQVPAAKVLRAAQIMLAPQEKKAEQAACGQNVAESTEPPKPCCV
jgi:4-carboxymuconolactone decarboxylase